MHRICGARPDSRRKKIEDNNAIYIMTIVRLVVFQNLLGTMQVWKTELWLKILNDRIEGIIYARTAGLRKMIV